MEMVSANSSLGLALPSENVYTLWILGMLTTWSKTSKNLLQLWFNLYIS